MVRLISSSALLLGVLLLPATTRAATEICGDGIDNSGTGEAGEGLTDEGCNPTAVPGVGVCESPLSCSRAGAVSPLRGGLVFQRPPDLAPSVPYGPGIEFRRFYMSLYAPGYNFPNDTDYKAPLGYRWHHNYMSWLEKFTTPDPDEVVLHTVHGQDVMFTYDTNAGGYDYYAPQPGYHFDYLRQSTSSPYEWELRTLTGTVYKYDWNSPDGMLIGILDGAGNEVAITYDNGQVDKITDASGNRYVKLEYYDSGTDKLLHWAKLYVDGTLRVSVEYLYSADKLTTVKIGGSQNTVETYGHGNGAYIEEVDDGDGNTQASIRYVKGPAGKIARIETGNGDIGYAYDTECAGAGTDSTYVYFHRANTTACDDDIDCGNGNYCGGETDPTAQNTGVCFRARRCLKVDSPNEHLVAAVTASCDSCRNTQEYTWDTGTSDEKICLAGTESAETGVWTSYERNSDGLVIKMVEGDDDGDATNTNPSAARTTYYFYGDTDFPGLVTEIRRQSELGSGNCNDTATAGCKRTIYTYNDDGLPTTIQEKGFTYDYDETQGTLDDDAAYDYTTSYTYDGNGRVTQMNGPRTDTSYDVIDYTYWSSTDKLKDGFLKEVKRQKAASTYLTTTYDEYDYWGNPQQEKDPNGNLTCREHGSNRNELVTHRVVMATNTDDCTVDAEHSSDLTTTYLYDTALRVTRVKKPEGNCWHYEYDGEGRLSKTKERDDCNAASSGDTIEYSYFEDGQLKKVEYKDSSGSVKKRDEYEYADDRRLDTIKNTVQTNYSKTLAYKNDGMLESISFENNLGKTEWAYDALNRVDNLKRYKSVGDDEWDVTPGVELGPADQSARRRQQGHRLGLGRHEPKGQASHARLRHGDLRVRQGRQSGHACGE